jgi:hypothetical protein
VGLVSRLSRRGPRIVAGIATAIFVAAFSKLPRLFDIELAFTAGEFRQTLTTWAQALASSRRWGIDEIRVFRIGVALDFLFIPAYACFLAAVYLRLSRPAATGKDTTRVLDWIDRLVLVLCAAAAAFDVLENIGLLALTMTLTRANLPFAPIASSLVGAMSSASALKWGALAVVATFILRASVAGDRGRVLVLSRYTLLSMLFGTLPLVMTPQGRDLLFALAADHAPTSYRVSFYLALTLWGLSVWYWSRVVLDAQHASQNDPHYQGFGRHLPRTLGALTLLLPALPLAFAPNKLWVKVAMIVGCVLLAGAFLVMVRTRHALFNWTNEPAITGFSLTAAHGTHARRIAIGSVVLSFTLFGLFVLAPIAAGQWLGPVAILFIAAANLVFFGSVAVFFSRTTRVHLDVVALACAAAFSFWNDNHDVHASVLDQRLPTLEQQYRQWRAQLPADATRPDVFLVAAEGGGIRAAYWTATVLGGLNEEGRESFGTHLFAVSGISGGTLGAGVYAALRHDYPQGGVDLRKTAQRVLEHDFLSPTIAKLVTGDFLQWFLPLPIGIFDRSTAMEASFMRAYENVTHKTTLGGAITTLMPDAASGVPALLMNTTIVETGSRAIIAPFTWTNQQIPDATVYTCWVGNCAARSPEYAAPALAPSIHNSARFTYVSPAGLVRSIADERKRHVVDGGYFDPTGVDTLLDVALALQVIDKEATFIPIYVTNATIDPKANNAAFTPASQVPTAPVAPDVAPDVALPNDAQGAAPIEILGEVFAPIRALLQSRGAHGEVAIARQQRATGALSFGFCRMAERSDGTWREVSGAPEDMTSDDREERRAEPPLGWQLSPAMTRRLDAYWTTCSVNRKGMDALKRRLDQRDR